MFPLTLILLVFAFVLFAIAAVWQPSPPSPWFGRLVVAGLACWTAAELANPSGHATLFRFELRPVGRNCFLAPSLAA